MFLIINSLLRPPRPVVVLKRDRVVELPLPPGGDVTMTTLLPQQ